MKYIGYVADIDDSVDSLEVDFEATDYCDTDAALVSEDRIRLEWTEDDEFWAVTLNEISENQDGEFGTGKVECTYFSREGGREIQRRELGEVTAIVIADDEENEYYELDQFWLDIKWTTGTESGRLLFELVRQ